ncbi:phosphatase PAP2 family protein [Maribacter sp. 2-571]|uniref:phosphatase PAP2 family protein n=1 Tax=Maribacter sp. 2-571 TaxID=3417569 RepID=UPI003D34F72D
MLQQLLQQDKELFLFLNGLGSPAWDGFWMGLTNKLGFVAIMTYALLLFLGYRRFGLKKMGIVLLGVALMILATDQLANLFKYGFERLRPCHDPDIGTLVRLVKPYCGGRFGYFSAHAANIMALVVFFTGILKSNQKIIGFMLFAWAIMVGYSRIYIGVHFPLDVLTGTLIGTIFGWLFAKLVIFVLHRDIR